MTIICHLLLNVFTLFVWIFGHAAEHEHHKYPYQKREGQKPPTDYVAMGAQVPCYYFRRAHVKFNRIGSKKNSGHLLKARNMHMLLQ